MGAATVSVRCPACGQDLNVVLASAPPTQWFPCPHCHSPVPVVVPRDLPPLYTWEVLPGLYPALPRPRVPRWRARRAAAAALIGVTVLALVFGGVLAYYGLEAPTPGKFTVSGTVYRELAGGAVVPASGALVRIQVEGGQTSAQSTGPSGSFVFTEVPTGGISLNMSLPGYSPITVETFVSNVYDAGTTGISETLTPGSLANGTTVNLSPFANLESFLASVGGAVVLFGLVAVVAGVASVVTLRQDRPPVGIVGGGAGLLAPVALYALALGSVFPVVLEGTAALAAFGGFTVALRAIEIAQTGAAPGPD